MSIQGCYFCLLHLHDGCWNLFIPPTACPSVSMLHNFFHIDGISWNINSRVLVVLINLLLETILNRVTGKFHITNYLIRHWHIHVSYEWYRVLLIFICPTCRDVLWYGVGVSLSVRLSTKLVNTIQTEPFQLGPSNLVHRLLMTRGWHQLTFKVMGQRSRSHATHRC